VSVACPAGHQSQTTDYCDQCGLPIVPASDPPAAGPEPAGPQPDAGRQPEAGPQSTAVLLPVEEVDTSTTTPAQPCPVCGTERSGDDRYCEGCGHDFLAPASARSADWEAVAAADRRQFESCAPAGVAFPDGYGERRFALDSAAVRIGRTRGRADDPEVEIDLAGPQEDPGVSRVHAVLERQQDGSYAVRDLGSTNGTIVNDDPGPIEPGTAIGLADGDRIRLGAWTTITLRKASEVVGRDQA